MFSFFFLVITSLWILKPLKKSLFIQFYDRSGFDIVAWHLSGPQAELIAKVLNMGVAFLAVIVFTWLARRFRRQQLTFMFTYLDTDGYLYFVDHKKDCIRRQGENISSFEVESYINTHPKVLECAAVGVPADLGAEDLKIVIKLKMGMSLSPEEVLEFCQDQMAYFGDSSMTILPFS